jgi:hypothetical protein
MHHFQDCLESPAGVSSVCMHGLLDGSSMLRRKYDMQGIKSMENIGFYVRGQIGLLKW